MPVCEGFIANSRRSGSTGGKCGAMAEPGMRLCAPHLKQSGYFRCACGTWVPPAAIQSRIRGKCPTCGLTHDLEK